MRESTYRNHELGGVTIKGIGVADVLLLGTKPRFVTLRWTPTRLFYFFNQDDPHQIVTSVEQAYGGEAYERSAAVMEARWVGWRLPLWVGIALLSPVPFLIGSGLWWLFDG